MEFRSRSGMVVRGEDMGKGVVDSSRGVGMGGGFVHV